MVRNNYVVLQATDISYEINKNGFLNHVSDDTPRNLQKRQPHQIGVLEYLCRAHISYLISHTHYLTMAYSHILYLIAGVSRALSFMPFSLYLWDVYRMLVCTHECLSGVIWSYLQLPEGPI